MTTGKLITAVAAGVLIAVAILFVVFQLMQPRDCALQLWEEHKGERLSTDVDSGCR